MNPEYLSKSEFTKTDFFNQKTNEHIDVVQANTGLTRKTARKVLRNAIRKEVSYAPGKVGRSKFAGMPSRKERRKLAKEQGTKFVPVLND